MMNCFVILFLTLLYNISYVDKHENYLVHSMELVSIGCIIKIYLNIHQYAHFAMNQSVIACLLDHLLEYIKQCSTWVKF